MAGLQVRLFARADAASKEWGCFTDLAKDLASYVQATNWAVRPSSSFNLLGFVQPRSA